MAVRWGLEAWPEAAETAANPQDAVIIRLLLEGLSPEEIAGLRARHIEAEERLLKLEQHKGGFRLQPVSNTCIRLLQQTLAQTVYPARLPDGTAYELKLERCDYVVKVTLRDHIGREALIQDPVCIRLRTIYNRLRKLSERFRSEAAAAAAPADVNLVS
jgi:integrase